MYKIIYSSQYKKAYKKIKRSGRYDLSRLEEVINFLQLDKELPPKYQNHKLKGSLHGRYECHIYNDLLLIYRKDKNRLLLLILNLGTHSQLF